MDDLSKLSRRLEETRAELLTAMRDLAANADDTVWLTEGETVFERLAYLYEVAGGGRALLVREWPEYFDA